MSAVDVVLQVFRAVEERNPELAVEVYHDDLEFHWPQPLPYAGSTYGLKASLERSPGWRRPGIAFKAKPSASSARALSPRARTRLWCCGTSAGATRPVAGSTLRSWGSTRFATESWPGPRCSTLTR